MPTLLALHGKKQHGKSAVAAHLGLRHGFVRMPFAAPLKQIIAHGILGLSARHTDGPLKERACVGPLRVDPEALARATLQQLAPAQAIPPADLVDRWRSVYLPLCAAREPCTPRAVLQVIGGGARRLIGASVWIDLWLATYQKCRPPLVVVEDLRYPDEKAAIEAEGGEVWRIVRTDARAHDPDASEVACDGLPDSAFAAVIRRPTGVAGLLEDVDHLLAARAA